MSTKPALQIHIKEKKTKKRHELTLEELKKAPLVTPVSFLANVWRRNEKSYFIPIDRDVVEKYTLHRIRVRVTIDPQTFIIGESDSPHEEQKAQTS